jgi:hypothetical protein
VKLNVRTSIPCSPARFWQMYWSDSFGAMSSEGAAFTSTVLGEHLDGAITVRRVRFEPHRELPRPVAAVVGAPKLVYEQEDRYDPAGGVIDFKLIPSFLRDKLSASGRMSVEPAGTDACTVLVSGDIVVSVRFIGGKVESAVAQEVGASYERMAATARRWLAEHGSRVS